MAAGSLVRVRVVASKFHGCMPVIVVSGMDYYLALLLSKHTAARLKCIVQVSMVASVSKQ